MTTTKKPARKKVAKKVATRKPKLQYTVDKRRLTALEATVAQQSALLSQLYATTCRQGKVIGVVWKDAKGNVRRIVDLDTSHLKNILQGYAKDPNTLRAITAELGRRKESARWRKKDMPNDTRAEELVDADSEQNERARLFAKRRADEASRRMAVEEEVDWDALEKKEWEKAVRKETRKMTLKEAEEAIEFRELNPLRVLVGSAFPCIVAYWKKAESMVRVNARRVEKRRLAVEKRRLAVEERKRLAKDRRAHDAVKIKTFLKVGDEVFVDGHNRQVRRLWIRCGSYVVTLTAIEALWEDGVRNIVLPLALIEDLVRRA